MFIFQCETIKAEGLRGQTYCCLSILAVSFYLTGEYLGIAGMNSSLQSSNVGKSVIWSFSTKVKSKLDTGTHACHTILREVKVGESLPV